MSESTQDDSTNSSEHGAMSRPETKPRLRRLILNLFLLLLCVLAVAIFLTLHVSSRTGLISGIAGSAIVVAFPNFLKWVLKRYEEEIQKQALDSLESSWLSRWLWGSVLVLVLLNLVILPQEARARIDAMRYGEPVELRIVPVGNLYMTLAVQDMNDSHFDLSIHRIAQHGKARVDKFYHLEKIGPGIIYTGAALNDLRHEHNSRANEEVDRLAKQFLAPEAQASDKLASDTNYTKENWRKFQYLGSDVFRQDDRIEIEIRCVRVSDSRVKPATFAKIDALLRELPIETVTLNAKLESNPCVPPD